LENSREFFSSLLILCFICIFTPHPHKHAHSNLCSLIALLPSQFLQNDPNRSSEAWRETERERLGGTCQADEKIRRFHMRNTNRSFTVCKIRSSFNVQEDGTYSYRCDLLSSRFIRQIQASFNVIIFHR
jgi:hypothetical protein